MSSAAAIPASLPLASAFNLRDFGGHETTDGRRVRRGMLYRSGTMALLTDADVQALRSLGIRAICDFRRGHERAAEPTAWHGEEVDYYCRDYSETSGVLGAVLKSGATDPEAMRTAMIRLYRDIPVDHAESYRAMFARLAEGRTPLLVNCSAGKDRTGVAVALILWALGVPRETILADYLATNDHADWDWLLARRDTLVARTQRERPDLLQPLLRAESAYLASLFDALDEEHGGIDAYLANGLGVDAGALDAMRAHLLAS